MGAATHCLLGMHAAVAEAAQALLTGHVASARVNTRENCMRFSSAGRDGTKMLLTPESSVLAQKQVQRWLGLGLLLLLRFAHVYPLRLVCAAPRPPAPAATCPASPTQSSPALHQLPSTLKAPQFCTSAAGC